VKSSMVLELKGLCEKCINDKCRKWILRNMDGIDGELIVHKCEFYVAEDSKK